MAGSDLSKAARGRRAGERGATLTLIALVSGMTLLALGTVYMSSAEKAYVYTALRVREAQLFAAADAGLVEALARLRFDRATPLDIGLDRDGVRVQVTSTAGRPVTVKVIATSGTRNDTLRRALVASLDFDVNSGAPLVLSARREGN